ncbi:MAG: hypothetical protein ACPGYJ_09255 [bacterium]
MFNLSELIGDQIAPARTGPGISFCTDPNADIFSYELRLRGQSPLRGSKRALNEVQLREMLENVYPEQIEGLKILGRSKPA